MLENEKAVTKVFKSIPPILDSDNMKGVSIPINTLVMLAVAIIVLLASVAWFMGAFGPAARESSLRQAFHNACDQWALTNCDGDVPPSVCKAYVDFTGKDWDQDECNDNKDEIAQMCQCTKPYGIERR